MKEDVLEQLVDDYLQTRGYFTRHNLKFRPRPDHPDFVSNQDSNHSDIDVIGYHPGLPEPDRVWAVSCKSWQSGFRINSKIDEIERKKRVSGREAWKFFRGLVQPKWAEAFITAVQAVTGVTTFTYVTAVTAIKGDRQTGETHPRFQQIMGVNPIRLIALDEMLQALIPELGTTISNSQLGRTLQLMKAAGFTINPRQSK
ncbi:MAG: hypothetical protein HY033_07650 [Ignavibacteriae bacterium]|nr:hypothetical protein [Ignavibacteriota bacterium]